MLWQSGLPSQYLLKAKEKITIRDIGPGRKKTGVVSLVFYREKHVDGWQINQVSGRQSMERKGKKPGLLLPKKAPGQSAIYKVLNMTTKFSSRKNKGNRMISLIIKYLTGIFQ